MRAISIQRCAFGVISVLAIICISSCANQRSSNAILFQAVPLSNPIDIFVRETPIIIRGKTTDIKEFRGAGFSQYLVAIVDVELIYKGDPRIEQFAFIDNNERKLSTLLEGENYIAVLQRQPSVCAMFFNRFMIGREYIMFLSEPLYGQSMYMLNYEDKSNPLITYNDKNEISVHKAMAGIAQEYTILY